jgi:hypothetical protein
MALLSTTDAPVELPVRRLGVDRRSRLGILLDVQCSPGHRSAPGLGTAIGGIGGCIIGGIGGYYGGEMVGEAVYDWAENTVFESLDEIRPAP